MTRYGQRRFTVSGSTVWNALLLTVCDPSLTLTYFCALLKTVLFCTAYDIWYTVIAPPWEFRLYGLLHEHKCIYLLTGKSPDTATKYSPWIINTTDRHPKYRKHFTRENLPRHSPHISHVENPPKISPPRPLNISHHKLPMDSPPPKKKIYQMPNASIRAHGLCVTVDDVFVI